MPRIVLMDSETAKMDIPLLLEGFAEHVNVFDLSKEEALSKLKDADAIITVFGKVGAEELRAGSSLKIVSAAAAGYNSVDVATATSLGIPVTRAATATVDGVAEHAFNLMMTLSRHLLTAVAEVKKGNWGYRDTEPAFGHQLAEKTLGIIGLGKVGSIVLRKGMGLGMKTVFYDPYVSAEKIDRSSVAPVPLNELLRISDFVCITAALTTETKYMIGEAELRTMKKDAILVNVARGGIVDESALHHALTEGWIDGAGLDVLEKEPPGDTPLLHLSNCLVTPHIAGLTPERYRDVGRVAVDEVKRVLSGGTPTPDNLVNPKVLEQPNSKLAGRMS